MREEKEEKRWCAVFVTFPISEMIINNLLKGAIFINELFSCNARLSLSFIQIPVSFSRVVFSLQIVSNSMQVKCKCHGMSGSCEMKTCWRTTPDYRQVGKLLKERYRSAVLVDQNNVGNRTPKNFKG